MRSTIGSSRFERSHHCQNKCCPLALKGRAFRRAVRLCKPLALATEGTRFLTLVAKVVERKLSRSPGANVSWVDRLDQETTPQQNATQAQPVLVKRDSLDVLEDGQLLGSKRDEDGERGRNRIRAETYIQQDAEQRTAPLAILVHVRQCERQVNGRWNPAASTESTEGVRGRECAA